MMNKTCVTHTVVKIKYEHEDEERRQSLINPMVNPNKSLTHMYTRTIPDKGEQKQGNLSTSANEVMTYS